MLNVKFIVIILVGDWGLGIGDWAIPNPQSPIPNIKKALRSLINC